MFWLSLVRFGLAGWQRILPSRLGGGGGRGERESLVKDPIRCNKRLINNPVEIILGDKAPTSTVKAGGDLLGSRRKSHANGAKAIKDLGQERTKELKKKLAFGMARPRICLRLDELAV